jgi:Pyridoxamine 5'-phosphate oxidase
MCQPPPEVMSRAGKGTQAPTDAGNSQPLPWSAVESRLTRGGWFWLATVRPDGGPHVVPVLAAWSNPVLYVASKATSRKSRNLAANSHCVLTTDTGDLHVIVEGQARRLREDADMTRASAAFDSVNGWPTRVVGDELDADYGAPTSGGPPYAVFEITPTKAFAFPTDGVTTTPTRWRFASDPSR